MTTWGDLRAGDVILDKNDEPWTVEVLALITGSDPELWRVSIRHADGRTPIVVKPATEPVTRRDTSPDLRTDWEESMDDLARDEAYSVEEERAKQVVADAFGEDKVELIATETTEEQQAREAATPDSPLRLPVIDHPASLRSHLYILHEFYVADVDSTLALQEHHRKQHADYPDQGTPHTHEEEK